MPVSRRCPSREAEGCRPRRLRFSAVVGEAASEHRRRKPEAGTLHRAVREGWPLVAAKLRLPRRVHDEVRHYLRCGDLRHGFLQVKCAACRQSMLVAFSCKGRGWCPSCGARRAHEAALHLLEALPHVAFRQWTLSLPGTLRWPLVKDASLLRAVERELVRAVFRWQRARARELGARASLRGGAVCFVQLFGSALQLTPHLHVLVPEGVFGGEGFVALPPPSDEEVAAVLARTVERLVPLFEDRQPPWPEDDFEELQARGAQLKLMPLEEPTPGRKGRLAVAHGLSLHADTWVHGNDRQGLARLVRYGARGPIAESRLFRREDGRYAYETKRGVTLVLTAEQLVRRLLWLIPPRGLHLTNFHGVFASHSSARASVLLPPAELEVAPADGATAEVSAGLETSGEAPRRRKRPRVDWAALQRHTFGCDVWQCPCGGRRRVVAVITNPATAEELLRRLGLWKPWPPLPAAPGPPQRELVLDC
jgi:hypothetical protein